MSDWGVFSVARDIWDHPVLGCETFTKREAWMWLVSAAAWKQRKVGLGSRVVTVERGEFCFSIRFLERKWKWKPGRVERFLKTLENHDMIRDTERDSDKVYSISNYNEYQLGRDGERDSNATETATRPRHDRDTTATKKKPLNHSSSKPEGKREERASAPPAKGTRWPPDQVVSNEWIADADIQRHNHDLPRIDLRLEATRFANYWASRTRDAARGNWHKTWINWALDDSKRSNGKANGRVNEAGERGTSTDRHLAGISSLISEISDRKVAGGNERG